MEYYDYIIAGGGCAGLSLAYHMSQSDLKEKRILIVDKSLNEYPSKTWCYWSTEKPLYKSAQEISWDEMEFFSQKKRVNQSIHPYQYFHVNGKSFFQEVLEHLRNFPNIHFLKEEILSIEESEDFAILKTISDSFRAKFVFSSIWKPSEISQSYSQLKQHFLGWTIESDQNIFDPNQIRLMDFRTSQDEKPTFVYILPFSKSKALVEFTVFSDELWPREKYESGLKEYLKEQFPQANYLIRETEKGIIPMTDFPFPKMEGKSIYRIGTSGGATKPTTGYTFNNIQNQSKEIVARLVSYGRPGKLSSKHSRFRFYDRLLLHIMQHEHRKLPAIFYHLFEKNDFRKVLKFLDEDTKITEEISIFLRLPWGPFLRALWALYFQQSQSSNHPNQA